MKNLLNSSLLFISLCCLSSCATKQVDTKSDNSISNSQPLNIEQQLVFNQLKSQDSLLFNLGFNQCDTAILRTLIHDDLEFYHDQSGLLESKDNFILGIASLCHLDYKPTRELAENSLSVYLLKDNDIIYGAIQSGAHLFYGETKERPKYLTSTAKFTHLWVLANTNWQLKRVLSYDHQEPN